VSSKKHNHFFIFFVCVFFIGMQTAEHILDSLYAMPNADIRHLYRDLYIQTMYVDHDVLYSMFKSCAALLTKYSVYVKGTAKSWVSHVELYRKYANMIIQAFHKLDVFQIGPESLHETLMLQMWSPIMFQRHGEMQDDMMRLIRASRCDALDGIHQDPQWWVLLADWADTCNYIGSNAVQQIICLLVIETETHGVNIRTTDSTKHWCECIAGGIRHEKRLLHTLGKQAGNDLMYYINAIPDTDTILTRHMSKVDTGDLDNWELISKHALNIPHIKKSVINFIFNIFSECKDIGEVITQVTKLMPYMRYDVLSLIIETSLHRAIYQNDTFFIQLNQHITRRGSDLDVDVLRFIVKQCRDIDSFSRTYIELLKQRVYNGSKIEFESRMNPIDPRRTPLVQSFFGSCVNIKHGKVNLFVHKQNHESHRQQANSPFWVSDDLLQCDIQFKKQFPHRKHRLALDAGFAEMECHLDRDVHIRCTTIQMFILQLFNKKYTITFQEILHDINISQHMIHRHLFTMTHPSVRLLTKKPMVSKFNPSDTFSLNMSFYKGDGIFTLPLINTTTFVDISKPDTHVYVDALIVRVMKKMRTCSHYELTQFCQNVNTRTINTRVEHLINIGYIKRGDRRSQYIYVP
jgi:hypothetical protein